MNCIEKSVPDTVSVQLGFLIIHILDSSTVGRHIFWYSHRGKTLQHYWAGLRIQSLQPAVLFAYSLKKLLFQEETHRETFIEAVFVLKTK